VRGLVEEAKAGFVIEPEDAAELERAILFALAHPEEAAARARNGREWVQGQFVREVQARRMAAFLERVCVS
jgi:glycosyltransferase involved in cell wall biosynthesis